MSTTQLGDYPDNARPRQSSDQHRPAYVAETIWVKWRNNRNLINGFHIHNIPDRLFSANNASPTPIKWKGQFVSYFSWHLDIDTNCLLLLLEVLLLLLILLLLLLLLLAATHAELCCCWTLLLLLLLVGVSSHIRRGHHFLSSGFATCQYL